MAYDPAALALARAASRWNLTKGNIWPGPAPAPPVQELEETTLAALRRSLRAEPGPLAEAAPPRRTPAEFRGAHRTFPFHVTTVLGVGNSSAQSTELLSLPMVVRRILVSTTADGEGQCELAVTTTLSPLPTEAEIRAGPPIYPDPHSEGPTYGAYAAASGAPWAVPLDFVLANPPFRIAVYAKNIAAGPYRIIVHLTAQDFDPEDLRVISVPVILTPQILTRSVRVAPLPPPRGPAYPKAVRIKVLQGGRPLYSRDVPWGALAPMLKQMWARSQGAGEPPGTMESLW